MRLVCVSDTHNRHAALEVPEGDVLVHAGDFTLKGTREEVRAFDLWLGSLPHRHKLVVAGNHDWLFERSPEEARQLLTQARYLQDSGASVEGVRFWGSPWQPWFLDWAFNLQRGAPLREKWDLIPEGVDVLVTHGPPHGVRDTVAKTLPRVVAGLMGEGRHAGCEELLHAVARVRPRLHVFGHIHEGYGRETRDDVEFVNASCCDERYRPVNPPLVVDL